MKVLIVSFYYFPEVGAAPSRITNMAKGLKDRGAEVEILTSMPNYPKGRIFDGYRDRLKMDETVDGITVHRYWTFATISKNPVLRAISMLSYSFVMWFFAFRRSLIKSYDRVIIQSPPLPVAYSAIKLFKGMYGKKVALNISDLWPKSAVELQAMHEGSVSYKLFAHMERFIYHQADGIFGQSNEILHHITEGFEPQKPKLLYRNLQKSSPRHEPKRRNGRLKLVYAGLLGVAQDVAGIVKNVPFKEMDVEFHILGGGKQLEEIEHWCQTHPDSLVYTHGFVPKEQVAERVSWRDASIIPLATRIYGAVPSKIYDMLPQGLPLLFCGGGEGAQFINEHNVGLSSEPADYTALKANILKLRDMDADEYEQMSARCIKVSREELDFDKQMQVAYDWLQHL